MRCAGTIDVRDSGLVAASAARFIARFSACAATDQRSFSFFFLLSYLPRTHHRSSSLFWPPLFSSQRRHDQRGRVMAGHRLPYSLSLFLFHSTPTLHLFYSRVVLPLVLRFRKAEFYCAPNMSDFARDALSYHRIDL